MILFRGLAFLFFVLLAAAIMAWQAHHVLHDVGSAWIPAATMGMMGFGLVVLVAELLGWRATKGQPALNALLVLSLPALPLVGPLAGIVSLLQLRTGDHKQIWGTALSVGALISLNLLLPLAVAGLWVGGSPGLLAGWSAIKFQFFLVVDYFLCRAILHYFSSGASAFVSLRFLRKRTVSLLAVVAIMLGVWNLIVVNSVMSGFQTDFREQMRGSLSHVLVRFRSEDVHLRLPSEMLRRTEWAEYVKRIEASEDMLLPWQAALENALELYRAADKDALPDPRDFAGQPPLPPDDQSGPRDTGQPDQPGLSDDEREFLQRLKTGVNLSDFDRECLRDEGRIVSPREFYLARVGDAKKAEEEIRRAWYAPVFRESLQQQFEAAERALLDHRDAAGKPDVEGVSWRVSTKTFITPKAGSRELPIAELVGVDVEREPRISRLGEYVADAERTDFRQQYVLGPLLNILGANLGWETEESVAAMEAQRDFMFTEDGRGIGRMAPDMTRTLAMRRFTTATGRVIWREFDNVRYHEFSPGRRIYERVREAHKAAGRTEDLQRLGEIMKSCEADVRAILLSELKHEGASERWQQVNYTGALIIWNDYLTGISDSVDAVRMNYGENMSLLKDFVTEAESRGSLPGEVALVNDTWAKLKEVSEAAEKEAKAREATEAEREAALLKLGGGYRQIYDDAISQADQKKYSAAHDLLQHLRAYSSNPENLLPLRRRLELRLKVPLSYAAENFDAQARAVLARMQAYREVLPLRTAMRPGESADEYRRRATSPGLRPDDDKPGIILGDALAESALGAGVNVGDSIAVTIPRIYYEDNRMVPRTVEVWFKVTGFFRSGLYEENRGRMYCDFEELTALLADSEVRYVVGARLQDYRPYEGQLESDKLKAELRQSLKMHRANYFSVGVWEDETRTLLEAVNIERTLIQLIVSFIIVLAGGAILMIVYQLVNEKVKDIGILKALGHSPWGIRSVFMFNALFIGLFGALLGCAAGMIFSEYLNQIEDFIDESTGIRLFPPDVYFLTYIPSVKGWDLLLLATDIAVPVIMFGFFCGILPSMAAARKDPVEALHYE